MGLKGVARQRSVGSGARSRGTRLRAPLPERSAGGAKTVWRASALRSWRSHSGAPLGVWGASVAGTLHPQRRGAKAELGKFSASVASIEFDQRSVEKANSCGFKARVTSHKPTRMSLSDAPLRGDRDTPTQEGCPEPHQVARSVGASHKVQTSQRSSRGRCAGFAPNVGCSASLCT